MRSLTVAVALPIAALSLVGLTACSGADSTDGQEEKAALSSAPVDEKTQAWQADVAEVLGSEATDFATLERNAAADCQLTTKDAWTISLALDGATSATTTALTRIGLEHACSDVVAVFDQGLAAVEGADDAAALACTLPREAAASDDRAVLDVVCQG